MTDRPWYWDDAMNDHDSCGLVLGVGRNGHIHYVKDAHPQLLPKPACNSGAAAFKELEFHGQLVTCRNCCSIAKHNRHKIKTREPRSSPGVIASQSWMNFIGRERQRKQEGRAWSGRHRIRNSKKEETDE
jgi:hypothetical protein